MSSISDIIRELDGLVSSIISASATRSAERRMGIIGIDVSLTISPLVFPEPQQPEPQVQANHESAEPLIDVIEGKDTIRLIAALPGIRKEDVRYTVMKDFLEIEIFADCVYRKRIPCTVRPEQVSVKSTTLNNSVLEIIFSKKIQRDT